ncbi:hypothetical protein [Phascolarctobacterium faecium]
MGLQTGTPVTMGVWSRPGQETRWDRVGKLAAGGNDGCGQPLFVTAG